MANRAKTRRPAGPPASRRPPQRAPAPTVASQADVWRFGALAVLGAWTLVVPFLGRAIDLVVNVAVKVEIVDHVIPGAVVTAVGTYLALRAHRGALSSEVRAVGGGFCVLGGFWVLATHVPLISQAVQGKEAWGSTLWHAWTSVPIVALSLWIVLKDR